MRLVGGYRGTVRLLHLGSICLCVGLRVECWYNFSAAKSSSGNKDECAVSIECVFLSYIFMNDVCCYIPRRMSACIPIYIVEVL